jgi:drug/metabolite transporter (DMT)-like permease
MVTTTTAPATGAPSTARIWTALVTVYFFWGTTYLAIDRSNQTIPSLVGPAIRFAVAGLALMAWSRIRGGWTRPTRAQWRTAFVVGGLLLFGGNASVAVAEDRGVDTGIVALIIALVPIWIALIDRIVLRSAPLGWRVVVGLAGGFGGAALLLRDQVAGDVTVFGLAVAVGASLSWAIGSLFQRSAPIADDPLQASGMQQLAGGIVIALGAIPTGQFGELDLAAVSGESALALIYLILFGSLLTMSAYLWLLRVARTSLVATYAYVNPVVAVTLGWLILDERVAGMTLVAAVVILASVALIVSAGSAARGRAPGEEADEREPSDAVEHRRAQLEPEIGFEG